MKIILGSANFGVVYGIVNTKKKLDNHSLKKIFKICKNNSINIIDTSFNYTNSEKIIGKNNQSKDFKIITKLPEIGSNSDIILDKFKISLKRLKREKLYALLTHSQKDIKLKNFKKIFEVLKTLKKNKQISKIGISVYSPHELLKIINKFEIDVAEVPISIFDQRFCEKKILKEVKKKNIEIYCRSVFLQGLIFLDQDRIKSKFSGEIKKIIKFKEDLNNNHREMINHCLNFIQKKKFIKKIIVGVNSYSQLEDIVRSVKLNKKKIKNFNYKNYIIKDTKILLPYKWKK